MIPDVIIYCDGSSGVDGSGGWGAVLMFGDREKEVSGGQPSGATNQSMEIMAAIAGLKSVRPRRTRLWRIRVYSDSAYVVNTMRAGWIENWREKGWRHKGGERPNRYHWETLEAVAALHVVEFVHVKGHNGDPGNERADRLAVAARHRVAIKSTRRK